jgi:hypothetical protein
MLSDSIILFDKMLSDNMFSVPLCYHLIGPLYIVLSANYEYVLSSAFTKNALSADNTIFSADIHSVIRW